MDLTTFPISTGIAPVDQRLQKINPAQAAIAILGGASVVAGVNLYKYAKPLNDQTLLGLASTLFIGGWLVVALAVSGGTVASVTQFPPALKSLIAFVSTVAIVAGATLERQKLDATNSNTSDNNLGMGLFLGGWAGIGLAMAWGNWSMEKIIATAVAIAVTLGGVFWTAQLETNGQNQLPGKITFGAGWVLMALAIGFTG